jgi:hypothetical protein
MYPCCDGPSNLLAYDASVYTFRVSELISGFGYLSVNDADFRKMLHVSVHPLNVCQWFLFIYAVRYLGGLNSCTRNIGSGIGCPRKFCVKRPIKRVAMGRARSFLSCH